MESSRIFVRGLPPRLTDEDFKKHFSGKWNLTDAKLIPHRRIGYVGFKSPEEAVRAVKYFNRTFIRMSKINVEIAKAVNDESLHRVRRFHDGDGNVNVQAAEENKSTNHPTLNPKHSLKRKRDGPEDTDDDPKLQEFLEVMQAPRKSKTWANEDVAQPISLKERVKSPAQVPKGDSDGDYEPVPRRAKKYARSPSSELQDNAGARPVILQTSQLGNERSGSTARQPLEENEAIILETEEQRKDPLSGGLTDIDWLRSRTSRLLDLQDTSKTREDVMQSSVLNVPTDRNELPMDTVNGQEILDIGTRVVRPGGNDPEEDKEGSSDATVAAILASRRLFVRNLSYAATEDDLRDHFAQFGQLEEVHLVIDPKSESSKGFAYVLYGASSSAVQAYRSLDGKIFQGRLLHILAAGPKRETKLDEYAILKLPLKKQKQIKKKAEAATSTFNWNSMHMNADAVMSSISDRLGISKSDILDPTSSESAVKQAHAETHIIQETKAYFASNGVNFDAFKKRERGDLVILVKNFPYGTKSDEIRSLFEESAPVKRLLMPPAGTIAIVEYAHESQARTAFASLAYRRFKDSILFLEKAPKDIFNSVGKGIKDAAHIGAAKEGIGAKLSVSDLLQAYPTEDFADTSTLFVRNLNFTTTTERLTDVFRPLEGLLSARVKTKPDPKKPGQTLSMGFGFLEFRTKEQARAALAAMNGYELDEHKLIIQASHKGTDAAEERRREDRAMKAAGRRTKIIIKNLPFEATKKDVRSLFSAYGQLRSVRVPKKFDSSTRGFAFADFVTAREAENAMDALRDTHLLGRKLVLEFAAEDPLDAEEEIEKMQKKVGKQVNKVALQRLTGEGRKKFNVAGTDEMEET